MKLIGGAYKGQVAAASGLGANHSRCAAYTRNRLRIVFASIQQGSKLCFLPKFCKGLFFGNPCKEGGSVFCCFPSATQRFDGGFMITRLGLRDGQIFQCPDGSGIGGDGQLEVVASESEILSLKGLFTALDGLDK